jgi:hypothetical protein
VHISTGHNTTLRAHGSGSLAAYSKESPEYRKDERRDILYSNIVVPNLVHLLHICTVLLGMMRSTSYKKSLSTTSSGGLENKRSTD